MGLHDEVFGGDYKVSELHFSRLARVLQLIHDDNMREGFLSEVVAEEVSDLLDYIDSKQDARINRTMYKTFGRY